MEPAIRLDGLRYEKSICHGSFPCEARVTNLRGNKAVLPAVCGLGSGVGPSGHSSLVVEHALGPVLADSRDIGWGQFRWSRQGIFSRGEGEKV